MAITVQCVCGKAYQLNEKYAGKRVKCPSCSAPISVPSTTPVPTAPSDDWINDPSIAYAGQTPQNVPQPQVGQPHLGYPQNGLPNAPAPQNPHAPGAQSQTALPNQHPQVPHQPIGNQPVGNQPNQRMPNTPIQERVRGGVNQTLNRAGINVPSGLPAVNKGVKLVLYGTLGSLVLSFGGGFLGPIQFIAPLATIGCYGLSIAGYYLCAQVPPESKARSLIYAVVVCSVLAMLGNLVSTIALLVPSVFVYAYFLIASGNALAGAAAFILFLLFIRKVALWLRQNSVAEEAMQVLYISIALFLLQVVSIGIAAFAVGAVASSVPDTDEMAAEMRKDIEAGESPVVAREKLLKRVNSIRSSGGLAMLSILTYLIGFAFLAAFIFLAYKYLTLLNSIDFRMPTTSARQPSLAGGWASR